MGYMRQNEAETEPRSKTCAMYAKTVIFLSREITPLTPSANPVDAEGTSFHVLESAIQHSIDPTRDQSAFKHFQGPMATEGGTLSTGSADVFCSRSV